jgi:uncharacterized protein (TIGR02246 family)
MMVQRFSEETVMRICLFAGVIALVVAPLATADGQDQAGDPTDAIRARVASYVDAFNQRDVDRLAGHWAESAVYVLKDSGEQFEGRDAIRDMFAEELSADVDFVLECEIASLRLITDGVAIEDGTARLIYGNGEVDDSTYTAIHVKQDGNWFLDSVRETDIADPAPRHERLRDLDWLIGEWEDRDDDSVVRTRCEWTKNGNFITRSFTAMIRDQVDLSGTQVIGWDAAEEKVRSWTFDSDGGVGEAVWTQDGDTWTIQAKATLADGRKGSAVRVIRRIDDDTFSWEADGREVGGQLLPNIDEVMIYRVSNE